jgi:hypothetical protein
LLDALDQRCVGINRWRGLGQIKSAS